MHVFPFNHYTLSCIHIDYGHIGGCAHCCYTFYTRHNFKRRRRRWWRWRMFVCEYALKQTADDFRLRAWWQKSTLNNADYVRKTVKWMPKARFLPMAPKFPSKYKNGANFFHCVSEWVSEWVNACCVCWFFFLSFTIHSNNRTLTAYSLYQTFSITPSISQASHITQKHFENGSLYVLSVDLVPLFSYDSAVCVCVWVCIDKHCFIKLSIRLFTRSRALYSMS